MKAVLINARKIPGVSDTGPKEGRVPFSHVCTPRVRVPRNSTSFSLAQSPLPPPLLLLLLRAVISPLDSQAAGTLQMLEISGPREDRRHTPHDVCTRDVTSMCPTGTHVTYIKDKGGVMEGARGNDFSSSLSHSSATEVLRADGPWGSWDREISQMQLRNRCKRARVQFDTCYSLWIEEGSVDYRNVWGLECARERMDRRGMRERVLPVPVSAFLRYFENTEGRMKGMSTRLGSVIRCFVVVRIVRMLNINFLLVLLLWNIGVRGVKLFAFFRQYWRAHIFERCAYMYARYSSCSLSKTSLDSPCPRIFQD